MSREPYEDVTVDGFPAYHVSNDGRVFSQHGRALKPQPRNGYLRVQLLGACGAKHWRPVHLLVLTHFVGPRPSPKHHGAHRDGDKNNNAIHNLEWKLPPANEADKKLHGTAPRGGARQASHPTRVRAIRDRVARGESYTAVALRFGLHRHSVSRIVRRLRRA